MTLAAAMLAILSIAMLVASRLGFALEASSAVVMGHYGGDFDAVAGLPDYAALISGPVDANLAAATVRPDNLVTWALLLAVLAGMTRVAVQIARTELRANPAHAADNSPAELAALTAASLGAAVWPWLLLSNPMAATVLSVLTMLSAISVAISGMRHGAVVRHSLGVGLFAGWAVTTSFGAFALFLSTKTPLSPDVAAMFALLTTAATGFAVQLRLGRATGFSAGVIWSLTGVAMTAIGTAPMVAIAAIIGIAAMTFVVVLVAS